MAAVLKRRDGSGHIVEHVVALLALFLRLPTVFVLRVAFFLVLFFLVLSRSSLFFGVWSAAVRGREKEGASSVGEEKGEKEEEEEEDCEETEDEARDDEEDRGGSRYMLSFRGS